MGKQEGNGRPPRRRAIVACVAGLAIAAIATLGIVTSSGTIAHSRLEKAFHRIEAAHKGDPSIALCVERAGLIGEVRDRILLSLAAGSEAHSNESMLPVGADGASALLAEYRARFASESPKQDLASEDLDVLTEYLESEAAVSTEEVVAAARKAFETGSVELADAVPLCLVIPLACVGDEDWTARHTAALPGWLRKPSQIEHGQWFCLTAGRPMTAYELAVSLRKSSGSDGPEFTQYFLEASGRLVRAGEFGTGVHCLRTGVSISERRRDNRSAATLRFELVDVFEQMGQTMAAAEEMKAMLAGSYEDNDWAKAALLRLKLLFKALEYAGVVEEADVYIADPRAEGSLPFICYVKWLALVRQDDIEGALKTRNDFLARFPEHILAADMHFAAAMEHLSKGNYEEALELLEFIKGTFPEARVAARCGDLIDRLKTTFQRTK